MDKGIGGILGVGGVIGAALILRGLSGGPQPQQAIAQPDTGIGGDEMVSCDLADARYGYRNLMASRIKRRADYLAENFEPFNM